MLNPKRVLKGKASTKYTCKKKKNELLKKAGNKHSAKVLIRSKAFHRNQLIETVGKDRVFVVHEFQAIRVLNHTPLILAHNRMELMV